MINDNRNRIHLQHIRRRNSVCVSVINFARQLKNTFDKSDVKCTTVVTDNAKYVMNYEKMKLIQYFG